MLRSPNQFRIHRNSCESEWNVFMSSSFKGAIFILFLGFLLRQESRILCKRVAIKFSTRDMCGNLLGLILFPWYPELLYLLFARKETMVKVEQRKKKLDTEIKESE